MFTYSENLDALKSDAGFVKNIRAMEQRREQINAQRFARMDSLASSNSIHLARDLEHMMGEVLKDRQAPLSGLDLFPMDTSVPTGATTYTIKRIHQQGQAKYFRGTSDDIPIVGVSADEESRSVRHIITQVQYNTFEMDASNFANSNLRSELDDAANIAIDQFLNKKIWTGSSVDDVYGIFNYPYLPKTVSTVSIDNVTAANTILAELHRLANSAPETSETVFYPDTLAVSPKKLNIMRNRKLSTGANSETILEAFLKDNHYITDVVAVPELAAAASNGDDIMLFFRRNDKRSIANVIPQGVTFMPIQTDGFRIKIPVYMSHGGIIMKDALNNLLVYTPA